MSALSLKFVAHVARLKNSTITQCILCLCDVTLSVYPHRAGLKNMPGHGGIRTYDLWNTSPMLFQCGQVGSSMLTQASYSPEYITPTQQISQLGRRMSIQKMLRKRIPLHPSWNYIIFI